MTHVKQMHPLVFCRNLTFVNSNNYFENTINSRASSQLITAHHETSSWFIFRRLVSVFHFLLLSFFFVKTRQNNRWDERIFLEWYYELAFGHSWCGWVVEKLPEPCIRMTSLEVVSRSSWFKLNYSWRQAWHFEKLDFGSIFSQIQFKIFIIFPHKHSIKWKFSLFCAPQSCTKQS